MKKIGVVGVPGGWSSEHLADVAAQRTGRRLLIDLAYVSLEVDTGRVVYRSPEEGEVDLCEMDGLILKKAGPQYSPDLMDRLELLRYAEGRGVRVFSPVLSVMRVLDRLACTVTLTLGDIPMPPTTITEDIDQAHAAVGRYGTAVLKPLYTSKARGMRLISAGNGARAALEEYRAEGHSQFYLQKKEDLGGLDLGVAFLGGQYLATYARAGGGGKQWHTSVRGEKGYQPYEPSEEIIELARKAQSLFNLDFTGVDVAITPSGPIVFEVSAFGGFRGLRDACGLDAAELYVNHVLEQLEQ